MNILKQLKWEVDNTVCNSEGMELTSYQPLMGVVAEYRIVSNGSNWECNCSWDKEMFGIGSMLACQLKCRDHMNLTLTNMSTNLTNKDTPNVDVLNLKLTWQEDHCVVNPDGEECRSIQPSLRGQSIIYYIYPNSYDYSCKVDDMFIGRGTPEECKQICKKHLENFIKQIIKHNS